VFLFYWFLVNKNLRRQNILLLLASYTFYGWWDYRFLLLLISITVFNYFTGLGIDLNKSFGKRKLLLILGLVINIGVLCIFKYFNFFTDSFIDFISLFGYTIPISSTRIILPLGISFYTFLSLSYLIDIYKKNLKANSNIIEVLLSLSFFPIILAGPIQRPSSLLPQISRERNFNYDKAIDGLRQILWGLFVKIAVADNLAPEVDKIFQSYSDFNGSTLFLGIVFYTLQIYADFSGYSNIAIGTAKLFGFDLMQNFAYPYFSRDITEFWKRWHISLTTWFRDYVFLPISFSLSFKIMNERVLLIKKDQFIYILASIITWFLTGLWHGPSYSFIIWGLINGFFLIIYRLQLKPRKKLFKKLGINNNSKTLIVVETIITLAIIMLAWIFFRTDNTHQALSYIKGMLTMSLFSMPQLMPVKAIFFSMIFIVSEWIQRDKIHALQLDKVEWPLLRWLIYLGCICLILFLGGGYQKFIYFQF
jgi:D-alanyl-lipoteichoic acid acyltransferase DltB (MBOAT superfamily)